ncbi:cell division protein FtsQ [Methylohalomonas lacus]|uniref:Cell division protein FtsQ n=1 Tax=Methylohalomonas lacus TaxID=398773 RepID=A0AAE3HJW8_9GAMM|nr:cell division protein FtsQ/DivIB [Methylohalomonas lacus]MCS3902257.1 cell division protein FtsQ [Methylohalomonas lacus]
MSTLDPLSDFHLPGPAARDDDHDRDTADLHLRGRDDAAPATQADASAEVPEHDFEAAAAMDDFDDVADGAADTDVDSAVDVDGGAPVAAAGSRRGSLATAALIAAGLIGLGWYLAQPETLPIKQVSVEGEFRELSRQELQALVSNELQGGFFSVDVSAIRNALTANAWVSDVQVQRVWPDALKIAVREQVPLARWNDTGLVNAAGDYFEPQSVSGFSDLPQINGPAGQQAQLSERLQELQQTLGELQLAVRELNLSERRAWSFTTTGGLHVVLGRQDFDTRLQRFVELVATSLGERLDSAAYIDMRYTNGFAVRFNDAAAEGKDNASKDNDGNGAA